ncbi:MAG: CRISPR-associated endonuclease Cas2, partial [Theionarchaea archaeon]|nr:CRISPR-associated endonuclease Cas2 [Theionarchaea archaeon]
MYVVVVYDISVERVNKVRIFLKQYLDWMQNSVLEGELTLGELKEVELGLKN